MKGLPHSISHRPGLSGINVDWIHASLRGNLPLALTGRLVCKMGAGRPSDSCLPAAGIQCRILEEHSGGAVSRGYGNWQVLLVSQDYEFLPVRSLGTFRSFVAAQKRLCMQRYGALTI